jgi:hypothetical protein
VSRDGSLLSSTQRLLERTYGMPIGEVDSSRFVIGDVGLRALYAGTREVHGAWSAAGYGARTLVREAPDGVRVAVYFPDAMIRGLERDPPQRGLGESNVDAFATLVEELDHLLCLVERVREQRPVSLFELELHANVSKHLVLTRFLAGGRGTLDPRRRLWLRWHLFHKRRHVDDDPRVRGRYDDAARYAIRLLDVLPALTVGERLATLRRFHRDSGVGKVRLIESLAAS